MALSPKPRSVSSEESEQFALSGRQHQPSTAPCRVYLSLSPQLLTHASGNAYLEATPTQTVHEFMGIKEMHGRYQPRAGSAS